jgi:hypothetical protein
VFALGCVFCEISSNRTSSYLAEPFGKATETKYFAYDIMKTVIEFCRRGLLLFLAFMLFGTTSCFAVDVHICQGEVQSFSLFGQAQPCENMEVSQEPEMLECCKAKLGLATINKDFTHFSKTPCCSNTSVGSKTIQNIEDQTSQVENEYFSLVIFPSEMLTSEFVSSVQNRRLGEYFPPPPDIERNFQALYQVLII